ncbi:hypothetical protein PIB30_097862 [Stylosanthes scabra]|uniref:Uncharacterized protein n=1 Tax=Stylosanthes scabra TaxID=79078 RepID=A0ABU6QWN7_9FABA|nr:hypothetical protein [Stylosanthes scabra]
MRPTCNTMETAQKRNEDKSNFRTIYIELNPLLGLFISQKYIRIPTLFYTKHGDALKESMLIVNCKRNIVQVRVVKGHCSAYYADGMEALMKLYRLRTGGVIKMRLISSQVFYVVKVRDRYMHNMPIVYQNLHAMFVGTSFAKEKPISKAEIFFSNVEAIHKATYKRLNLELAEPEKNCPAENPQVRKRESSLSPEPTSEEIIIRSRKRGGIRIGKTPEPIMQDT